MKPLLKLNPVQRALWLLSAMVWSNAVTAQIGTNPLIPAPTLTPAPAATPAPATLSTPVSTSAAVVSPVAGAVSPSVWPLMAPATAAVTPSANPLQPMTTIPDKTLKLAPATRSQKSATSGSVGASPKSKAAMSRRDPVRAMQDEMPALDDGVAQHVVWNKVPITVSLRVGQERRITLPSRMRIAVPPDLSRKLALLLVDDTAYVTATASFEKIRLIAEDPVRGMVLLMDVSASKTGGDVSPVTIHLPNADANRREEATARNATSTSEESAAPDYVALTRFAAKQIYAPRRLATDLPGVATVGYPSVSIKGLYRLGNLDARAIGAWRSESLYVTAVKLTNLGVTPLELDPRDVRGAWVTISFQHGRLLAKGDEADTTVMYVVSEAPFESSL